MSNGQGNLGEAIGTIIVGILGGIALAALLEWLIGPRCPVCQEQIHRGVSFCPHCQTPLTWSQA